MTIYFSFLIACYEPEDLHRGADYHLTYLTTLKTPHMDTHTITHKCCAHTLTIMEKSECHTHTLQFSSWMSYIRSVWAVSWKLPNNFCYTVSTFLYSRTKRKKTTGQPEVCQFIKDLRISNYRVTTVWLRDIKLERKRKP